ncbi:PQQ-binding-like beta-propeller repeat protein [Candidatus Poribacteria bacterium]|nr:PQQ-binding-like beta-propeller repeat protein [Candidatus Poribacteria bacterium]
MNRKFILLLISFFLLWGCQSQDQNTQPTSKPKSEPESQPKSPPVVPAVPTRAKDWPMFMYDLHFSGRSPDQTLAPPLKLLWKYKTGGPIQASPVIAYGMVYVASTDHILYALDAKQWGIKWSFKAGGVIRYAPTVWNNRVYFSARNNHIYALNAQTGDWLWEFRSETWMDSPPILSKGRLYIGAYTQKIYVIDATTGELESQLKGRVYIDGIEYACSQGRLRPIAPQHDVNAWRKLTPLTYSYPAIANGVVYIGARDNQIHALDIESQEEIWSYPTKGFIDTAPAISDGILYVTSDDGYVYAFTNQEGEAPQALPQESESSQISSEAGPIGTVVRDLASVYTERDAGSPVSLTLNDGVTLSILNQIGDWYQIELPNGEVGWMDGGGIGVFVETDDIHFNIAICKHNRTLALIEGAEYPHWSPRGKRIAFLRRTNLSGQYWQASELWISDAWAKQPRRLHKGVFYNPHLSWSLDSNFIAFEAYDESNESHIWAIDWKNLRLIKLVRGDAPAWSPTANQIAFRRWEEGTDVVYRINIDKTGLMAVARVPIDGRIVPFSYLDPPVWSPDGKRIAVGLDHQHYQSGHSRIRIHNIDGTKFGEIPTQSQRVTELAWSPDGSHLAYVLRGNPIPDPALDKQLHIVDVSAMESANTVGNRQVLKHTSPTWSPQGDRLAYMEREDCMGLRWKVWVLDRQTNRVLPVARTSLSLTAVTWLPDGKHLCLWHTSEYLRGGEYKPAKTRGWIVELNQ